MTTPIPESMSPSVERTSVRADDPSAAPSVAERGRAALATLQAVRSPSLAPLVRFSPQPEGIALTHLVPTGAVTAAELRRAAPLRAGHVLTVALAAVDAVVALADAGLAHGGVRAENVLVAPDGSVVLGASGLAWRRPPGDAEGPRVTDDVAAVGDLVRDLLGRASAPSPLVLAALRAGDADPQLRPEPAELRAALARCGRSDPLLDLLRDGPVTGQGPTGSHPGGALDAAGPGVPSLRTVAREVASPVPAVAATEAVERDAPRQPRPRRSDSPPRPVAGPRRRRRGRRRTTRPRALFLVAALVLIALGVVRVGARALADTPPAAAGPTIAPTAAPATSPGAAGPVDPAETGTALGLDRGAPAAAPDWTAVLTAVDAGRQRAIATGSVAALRDWVDPSGPAWPADTALAARVSALHARIEGGSLVVLDVRAQAPGASRSVLLVRDRRDAYAVVTPEGTSRVPERAPRWWRVTLVRAAAPGAADPAGWRVHDVAPVAPPAG